MAITISGNELSWASADIPVTFVINSAGSADVSDNSEVLALRQGFQRWEDVTESDIAFVEDAGTAASRTDYTATDIHLILFDETDATGLFPGLSGIVAVTPITFNSLTGQILDADIIFNGDDHSFSTDKSAGTFDVQSIATHEIGHFIGLDHSASCASTMFPFAEVARTPSRSLTIDDRAGAIDLYPGVVGSTGNISGVVERSFDSSAVAGAHVVAVNSDGAVTTATYSMGDGSFLLELLPADSYTIYAEPLDSPVSGSNLSSDIGGSAATDFQTTYAGGNSTPTVYAVTGGSTTMAGTLAVGAPGSINLLASSAYPILARRNGLATAVISGSGLLATDTISFTGTGVSIFFSSYSNSGTNPTFTLILQTTPTAALGPRNLEITSGTSFAVLTGVVEVVEEAPTITTVSPSQGTTSGGTSVTITGTGFQSGAEVIFGDTLAAAVSVDSSTQITATSPSGSGTVDLFVENPDAQLVEESSGFTYYFQPTITSIYATGGTTSGGTQVVIVGSDFVSGLAVTFGGTAATVSAVTSTTITCTTPAGSAGAADVVVTNPGGLVDTLTGGFTYTTAADPVIAGVDPSTGPTQGSTQVTVTGSGFAAGALVYLGRDSAGAGGVLAGSTNVVSSTEITFVTPPQSSGTLTVHVENVVGSVAQLGAGFTYADPVSGGGGGGGCFAMPAGHWPGGGPGPTGIAGGLLPYLCLVLTALAFRRHERLRPFRHPV